VFRFLPDGPALEFLHATTNNTWGLGFTEEFAVLGSTANANPSFFMTFPAAAYQAAGSSEVTACRQRLEVWERCRVIRDPWKSKRPAISQQFLSRPRQKLLRPVAEAAKAFSNRMRVFEVMSGQRSEIGGTVFMAQARLPVRHGGGNFRFPFRVSRS